MNKKCFAYNVVYASGHTIREKCMALATPLCESGKCPFFKTTEQIEAEKDYTEKRIKKLYKVDSKTFVEMGRRNAKG